MIFPFPQVGMLVLWSVTIIFGTSIYVKFQGDKSCFKFVLTKSFLVSSFNEFLQPSIWSTLTGHFPAFGPPFRFFFREVPILFVQKGEKKPSSQQITTVDMEVVIFKKLQQYMHSVETGFIGMPSQEMFHAPRKPIRFENGGGGGGVQCPSIWGKSLGSRSSIRKCQVNDDMYHVPSLKPNELHLNIGRANAPKGNSSPNHHLFRGLC